MMTGGAAHAKRHEAHEVHRNTSRYTTRAMLRAAMCFVPQGDTDTSRRLFDALATGCVPVIVKVNGGKPREAMLSNLPFHHTINWRALVHAISAGGARLGLRYEEASNWVGTCRREEASILNGWYEDATTVAQMRRNGLEAFSTALDVELNPKGVASAMLRELAYVFTDVPASVFLPPPHMLPPGLKQWPNMSNLQWLWK